MADPPPGLALDGVVRLPEPFAYVLPPTQPLVNDGAVAASEAVAMPSIGRGVTFDVEPILSNFLLLKRSKHANALG